MDLFEYTPLEPCPLCGQQVEHRHFNHYHQGEAIRAVHLIMCPCGVELTMELDPRDEYYEQKVAAFLAHWNTRR